MVKTIGPLFSITASGTIGKSVTFQGGKSGTRAMRVPKHGDNLTDGQSEQRASFREAASSWRALTEDSKDIYRALAGATGLAMNGYNYYLSTYLKGTQEEQVPPIELEGDMVAVPGEMLIGFIELGMA